MSGSARCAIRKNDQHDTSMDRAAKYVAAPMTAAMVLDLMNPDFAAAQQVKPDDKRIKTEWVEIDSPKGYGKIKAYVCKPANATGKLPTVLVVHAQPPDDRAVADGQYQGDRVAHP